LEDDRGQGKNETRRRQGKALASNFAWIEELVGHENNNIWCVVHVPSMLCLCWEWLSKSKVCSIFLCECAYIHTYSAGSVTELDF